jgi:amino acid permease
VTCIVQATEHPGFGADASSLMQAPSAAGLASFFGTTVFAFAGQTEAVSVWAAMKNRNEYTNVVVMTSLIAASLSIVFAVIVCLAFGQATESIIFVNLHGQFVR